MKGYLEDAVEETRVRQNKYEESRKMMHEMAIRNEYAKVLDKMSSAEVIELHGKAEIAYYVLKDYANACMVFNKVEEMPEELANMIAALKRDEKHIRQYMETKGRENV